MKKMKILMLGGITVCALGLGVIVGAHHSEAVDVKAATETTVYYSVPSSVVGSYSVKLNVNFQGDGEWWNQFNMVKTDETLWGNDVYRCTYTDAYDGVGAMQFQLYNGGDWVSQQAPITVWTPVENYNGKVYVHDAGWFTYGDENYITLSPSFFTNWTDNAGRFEGKYATFWNEGYSFEAIEPFFRGEANEGWTGTLTSRIWKQSTQFVYFQLGGARDFDHGSDGHAHLVFHYGPYSADFYNNTFVENPMTLRYFKIPDAEFSTLKTLGNDFDMYVEVVDPVGYGYGFVNFGYLHINQTEESTSDAMRYFLNHMSTDSREWEVNKRREIMNTYFNNAEQRAVFFRTVSDISDSFSSNSDFTKHWYFDHNYFNGDYGPEKHFDKAIGTDTYRPEASTNMPFNNDGGFFRGWYEGSVNAGFVSADNLRYRFVSRPFVLKSPGIISIKMAGKASLHVINATVQNTTSQEADLAWIDNKAFQMGEGAANMAESGFNTTAMVRHVINLEAYVGKTIQLAICDYDYSDWSAAYFDELVTDHSSSLGYRIEYAIQSNNSGTFYPVFRDIYINSTCKSDGNQYGVIYNSGNSVNTDNDNAILNHIDSSDALAAHNVWTNYINVVRGGNSGNNYCSALVSDDIKAVLNSYNSSSEEAQRIFCSSDDFERIGGVPTVYDPQHEFNIGRSLSYLGSLNGINVNVYGAGYSTFRLLDVDTSIVITVVLCVLSMSTIAMFIILKKRRMQRKY